MIQSCLYKAFEEVMLPINSPIEFKSTNKKIRKLLYYQNSNM